MGWDTIYAKGSRTRSEIGQERLNEGFAVEAQRLPDRLDKSEQRAMDTGSTPAEVTPGGSYEAARFNALRHGVLSRYTVLP